MSGDRNVTRLVEDVSSWHHFGCLFNGLHEMMRLNAATFTRFVLFWERVAQKEEGVGLLKFAMPCNYQILLKIMSCQ